QSALVKTQQYTSLSVVSRAPLDWYPYAKGLKKEIPDCRVRVSNVPVLGGQARLYERGECPGRTASTRQLFVAGDSHALAYHEMLQRLAVLDGAPIRLYGSGGCALVGLRAWQGPNPACEAYARNVLEDIQARARPGDVVLLAGLRLPRLSEQYALFNVEQVRADHLSETANAGRTAEIAQWVEQLTPLADRGVHIVLEAPKPVLPAPPYRCSDAFNRHNPICANGMTVPRSEIEALRAPVLAGLRQVAAGLPGASIWDPMPLLCPGEQCLPTREGKPLFFDGDHLSGYGNRLLLPDFQAQLERLETTAPAAVP
ncbi:MAG: SGNH hydrolase domain-containing protein, partial [Stenotrophomonas maltophilia]